jgi:tetratricopeptide (TPR) repeat protein
MCLAYQHQEYFNVEKLNKIINVIEDKCPQSKIFFSTWLRTRAMVFEKNETLEDDRKVQEQIINGYKIAYNEGINYAGGYLGQFLLEAIVINKFFNPRRVEDIGNYYGYGRALEIFGQEKQELLDIITNTSDVRTEFVYIQYSNFNPILYNSFCNYQNFNSILEFNNEAIKKNNKGLEFEKAGDLESAVYYFSEAITLNHVYVNAYSNRGNTYNKMGDNYMEYALADFNTTLLLNPKHENTLFKRGMFFLMKRQFEKAIIDFTELININCCDSEAYLKRGICYFNTKRPDKADKALEDYNKAIEINPHSVEAYYNRCFVYKLFGDNEKAQNDFCIAKKIDPDYFLRDDLKFFIQKNE